MNPPVLFTLPEFLRPAECAAWIELAAAQGFAAAPVTTKLGPLMMPEARNNTRVMLDDAPGTEVLWSRLQPHVAPCQRSDGTWLPVGLNERLRFYRYEPGQMFRWHRDGAFVRDARVRSLLTFIVYLDEGCVGGETEFEDRVVTPARGMALIFSHHLLHQGAMVREGVKHVLRSDVMYRLS